jgi:hypothetical protein
MDPIFFCIFILTCCEITVASCVGLYYLDRVNGKRLICIDLNDRCFICKHESHHAISKCDTCNQCVTCKCSQCKPISADHKKRIISILVTLILVILVHTTVLFIYLYVVNGMDYIHLLLVVTVVGYLGLLCSLIKKLLKLQEILYCISK